MIKRAKTEEEKKQCINFFRERGLETASDLFLYVSDDLGIITGVAGLTVGVCNNRKIGFIEPYICTNNISNLRLYSACEGMMLAWDVTHIVVGCEPNETTENMYKQMGYVKWSSTINQYIKQV